MEAILWGDFLRIAQAALQAAPFIFTGLCVMGLLHRLLGHVQSIYGNSHVFQLNNDMVIRSDCPAPFDLVPPTNFAMVSGRQSPQRRVDRASWNQMAHEEWARRCDILPAPAWTHPNGGLYLYGTEIFGTMFAEVISHLLPTGGKHDLGCDECLIVNQLWTYHRNASSKSQSW